MIEIANLNLDPSIGVGDWVEIPQMAVAASSKARKIGQRDRTVIEPAKKIGNALIDEGWTCRAILRSWRRLSLSSDLTADVFPTPKSFNLYRGARH